jgi:hypothetical protein
LRGTGQQYVSGGHGMMGIPNRQVYWYRALSELFAALESAGVLDARLAVASKSTRVGGRLK